MPAKPHSPFSNDTEQRRRALFDRVMRLPDGKRAAYIERETAGEPDLREGLLRLVAASRADSSGVLDRPLVDRKPARPESAPPWIGGYKVVRRLGSGGMGTVYACREGGRGDLVAVKLLRADLQISSFLRRFEEERAIHSRLQHPNVCRILGAGAAEQGTPFIVMEMVEGDHIDAYCRRARLSPFDRLLLFSQVLAGVEYLHKQNIVHRDLKPSNILVGTDGKVSILDFGIAKIVEHRPGLTGHGATRTPLPIMTIRYASPEQLQQLVSGRASDIYALGVLLYELLTGHHPFTPEYQQGQAELVAAMAHRSPLPPGRLAGARRAIPDGTDHMVLKALRFDPGQRHGSAVEFLDELRKCLESV